MEYAKRQAVLDVLNSLEVSDSEGGESAFIEVHHTLEVTQALKAVGVPAHIQNRYEHNPGYLDILHLALSEGYADYYAGDKLLAYEEEVRIAGTDGEHSIVLNAGKPAFVHSTYAGGGIYHEFTVAELKALRHILDGAVGGKEQ